MAVANFIGPDAYRVADEYIDYRLADGWSLQAIAFDLDCYDRDPARNVVQLLIAQHWQITIKPASREASEAGRRRRHSTQRAA